jgi:hypothetical protein
MNEKGHPATLVPSHPGNTNAMKSGVYSRTGAPLEPRVQELVDALMAEPHTDRIDEIGAREIAKLIATIEAIDNDLAENGLTRKNGEPRGLIDLRLRATKRLADWLDRYGATPLARATWAKQLASGASLADDIARRRREHADG